MTGFPHYKNFLSIFNSPSCRSIFVAVLRPSRLLLPNSATLAPFATWFCYLCYIRHLPLLLLLPLPPSVLRSYTLTPRGVSSIRNRKRKGSPKTTLMRVFLYVSLMRKHQTVIQVSVTVSSENKRSCRLMVHCYLCTLKRTYDSLQILFVQLDFQIVVAV